MVRIQQKRNSVSGATMIRRKGKKVIAQHVCIYGKNHKHGLVSMRLYLFIKIPLLFKNGSLNTFNLEFVHLTSITLDALTAQVSTTFGKYLPHYHSNTTLLTAG